MAKELGPDNVEACSLYERIIGCTEFISDPAKVLYALVDLIIDETKAESCSFLLLDRKRNRLVLKAATSSNGSTITPRPRLSEKRIEPLGKILDRVVKEAKPLLVSETKKELFMDGEGPWSEIGSLLCAPIVDKKNHVMSVFMLCHSQPSAFNHTDQLLLGRVSNVVAPILANSLLYQELQGLSKKLEEKIKRKTDALRESEKKYWTLIKQTTDGIFIFQGGRIRLKNKRFGELFDLSSQRQFLDESERSLFVGRLEEYLRKVEKNPDKKKNLPNFDLTVTRTDKTKLDLEIAVTPIEYKGKPAIQGVVRDITARKALEKLKSSRFLAMATHEMRNAITVIAGYNKMLLKKQTGPLNATQRKILKECQRSCDRFTHFANEMLELSRIETGKMRMNFQEAGIDQCIKNVLSELRSSAQKKNISLRQRIPKGDLPKIFLDRSKIDQVLINLTKNALQYTPEGGKITIEVIPPCKDFIQVCVADNGIGVAPEEREIIFDEFVVGTHACTNEGVGLGLAICKKIIELHGGRIWVLPGRRGGSKFTFTLPLTPS